MTKDKQAKIVCSPIIRGLGLFVTFVMKLLGSLPHNLY